MLITISWILTISGSFLMILDFFLPKRRKEILPDFFYKYSQVLDETPIKDWIFKVAVRWVKLFIIGPEWIQKSITETIPVYKTSIFKPVDKGAKPKDRNPKRQKTGMFLAFSFMVFPILSGILYYFVEYWILGTYFSLIVIFQILITINISRLYLKGGYLENRDETTKYYVYAGFSVIVSAIAFVISKFIDLSYLNCYWFEVSKESVIPKHPICLPLINFPFDFATIYISVSLLLIAIENRKLFGIVALIDIILSLILSFFLYVTLNVYQGINQFNWNEVYQNFLLLISFDYSKPMLDLHLLPVILSTLAPILIYMSLIISLAISGVITKLFGFLFNLFWEKGEKIIAQFGGLMIAIGSIIGGILEYLK